MERQAVNIPILYQDKRILVCQKPSGLCSADQPGGLPDCLRAQLGGAAACLRTVHRLDQPVGGVMVLARSREAARILSRQVEERRMHKEYLAVLTGVPETTGLPCARAGPGGAGGGALLPGAACRGAGRARPGATEDRAHPSDPRAVRLTRTAAGGGRQIRRAAVHRGGDRPVVLAPGVSPSAERRACQLFCPAAGAGAVELV